MAKSNCIMDRNVCLIKKKKHLALSTPVHNIHR